MRNILAILYKYFERLLKSSVKHK